MPSLHISLKISIYDIGHTLGKFPNGTQTDTISVDQLLMIEFVYEWEDIPEEITHFELELIVIFLCQTLSYLLDFILRPIYIVADIRFRKPSIKLAISLLEPEKSGESLHGAIVEVSGLLQQGLQASELLLLEDNFHLHLFSYLHESVW